jgi:hypothetical protein
MAGATMLAVAGIVAAVAAGGQDHARHARAARAGRHVVSLRDLRAAASYLGITPVRLASDLQSGQSLDAVAAATPGRSAAGLVGALVAEKRQRLGTLAASVTKRANAEATRRDPALAGLSRISHSNQALAGPTRLESIAASYLGMSPAALQSALRGRTLAEVAASTPGRSAQGLVAALLSARRENLDAAAGARRFSQARAEARDQHALWVVESFVGRRFPAR